jgi:hypothetical protein
MQPVVCCHCHHAQTCGETGEPSTSVTSLARWRPSLLVPIA